MTLREYKRKRDFGRTPEPRGRRVGAARRERSFVVQKHDASRLHFDFRLEHAGTMWSWAVPKGPSLVPGRKRLAIHVEDHPVEYGSFEGVIPEGEYGGGPVMVWDRGTWAPEGDAAEGLRRGKLSFTLHGERLRGGWTLARLDGDKGSNGREQWLLMKRRDAAAAGENETPVVDRFESSVATGRTMEEIRGAGAGAEAASIGGSVEGALPESVAPQLCTLVRGVPKGDEWVHEVKFDGYRLIARRSARSVRLLTRTGKDWTARFAPVAEAVGELAVRGAVLDGEVVVLDERGHSSFQRLQNAIKAKRFGRLAYFVFDVLYLDGHDLRGAALVERKRALRAIVPEEHAVLRYSEHIVGRGGEVYRRACGLGMEGVVSKLASARYEAGRSRRWVKVKCSRRQEFVVIGWTEPSGSRKHFGALLLAAHDERGRLVYCGRVGTGFTGSSLADIGARLRALERATCPAEVAPTRGESRGVRWARPELVAEVSFTQWTDDGRLRHPSFQGLREDKEPGAVVFERPSARGGAG